jgi:hypothetical protein
MTMATLTGCDCGLERDGCRYPQCPQGKYDDNPSDYCDHEDYEADILTGRATCPECRHSWHLTADEIANEQRRQREYDAMCERLNRRENWSRRLRWLLSWWPVQHREDEIPF